LSLCGQLQALTRGALRQLLGSHGDVLYERVRGVDPRPVCPHRELRSIGHEDTFAVDRGDLEELRQHLDQVAERIAKKLVAKKRLARTIVLKARYPDFQTVTRSLTLEAPTRQGTVIARAGRALLKRTEAGARKLRLLGLSAHGLVHAGTVQRQLSLFAAGKPAQ
jgi:DNA polymerase-4